MTASPDAAGFGDGGASLRPRRASNILLTAAVLILIYDRAPLPYGLDVAKPWLRHALLPIGAMLAANALRYGIRNMWAFAIRLRRSLAEVVGVQLILKKKHGETSRGD